jgi:rRNA maturation endonuclease Nob1
MVIELTEEQQYNLRILAHDVSKLIVDREYENYIPPRYVCSNCGKDWAKPYCPSCGGKKKGITFIEQERK